MRGVDCTVRVELLIVDDVEIIALTRVVAEANVAKKGIGRTVVLHEVLKRELHVGSDFHAQAADMRCSFLIAIGKTNPIQLVEPREAHVAR